jgi:hypothetical protein
MEIVVALDAEVTKIYTRYLHEVGVVVLTAKLGDNEDIFSTPREVKI